jgi:hypothetical protein
MKTCFFAFFLTLATVCHAGPRQLVTLESQKYGAEPWTEINLSGGVAPYLVFDNYMPLPETTSGRFWLPYYADYLSVTDANQNRVEFVGEDVVLSQPVWNISLGAGATPEPSGWVLALLAAFGVRRLKTVAQDAS